MQQPMQRAPRLTVPIVIYSFARPDYLDRLCASLRAQQGVSLDESRIHLLQDGAVSPRSQLRLAADAAIEQTIATFRRHFPGGQVHAAPANLGIAMNLQRGEALVFEELDAEIGYFFEEDLELGPFYLAMLEHLAAQAAALPRLGYFAAYGRHRQASDADHPRLVQMEHHWGFGLTRRCWRAMQPWLAPFLEVWRRIDYQGRPHLHLAGLYRDKPVASALSSQDVAKTLACSDLGFARVNTDVCYARYIGERGESFRADSYRRNGFDRMDFVTRWPETPPRLEAAALDRLAAARRARDVAYRETRYEAQLAEMGQRLFDPDRPATRQDIEEVWRVLLDRLPEDEAYFARNVGHRTVRQIRTTLLRSREGRSKTFYLPPAD